MTDEDTRRRTEHQRIEQAMEGPNAGNNDTGTFAARTAAQLRDTFTQQMRRFAPALFPLEGAHSEQAVQAELRGLLAEVRREKFQVWLDGIGPSESE